MSGNRIDDAVKKIGSLVAAVPSFDELIESQRLTASEVSSLYRCYAEMIYQNLLAGNTDTVMSSLEKLLDKPKPKGTAHLAVVGDWGPN